MLRLQWWEENVKDGKNALGFILWCSSARIRSAEGMFRGNKCVAHGEWVQQEFANLKAELTKLRHTVDKQNEDKGLFEHL